MTLTIRDEHYRAAIALGNKQTVGETCAELSLDEDDLMGFGRESAVDFVLKGLGPALVSARQERAETGDVSRERAGAVLDQCTAMICSAIELGIRVERARQFELENAAAAGDDA